MKCKLYISLSFIVLLFVILNARVIYILKNNTYEDRTNKILQKQKQRKTIFDRNGIILAQNNIEYNLYLNSNVVYDLDYTVEQVEKVLFKVTDEIKEKIAQRMKKLDWVLLKKNITFEQKKELEKLKIPGLEFERTYKRYYPQENLFSHIVGLTNHKNEGIMGVERFFNKELKDANITLTIDARFQSHVRQKLLKYHEIFQSKATFAMVVNIETSEIMAMVSIPDFNPNETITDTKNLKNNVVGSVYNLGSIFKMFAFVASIYDKSEKQLEEEEIKIEPIKLAYKQYSSDPKMTGEEINIYEAFSRSSNVFFASRFLEMGQDKVKKIFNDLELFKKPSIELTDSEIAAPIYDSGNWNRARLATSAYGYGISLSPFHFVSSILPVFNQGIKRDLTLIKEYNRFSDNSRYVEIPKDALKHINKAGLKTVEEGTAKMLKTENIKICSKTGTSLKFDREKREWSQDRKMVSNITWLRCDEEGSIKPRYLIYVGMDEPRATDEAYEFLKMNKKYKLKVNSFNTTTPLTKEIIQGIVMAI